MANLLTGTTATSGSHSFASAVGSSSGSSYTGINSFLTTDRTYPHSTLPKAYLNYVFFDENFNYIPYDGTTGLGSYGVQIETEGDAMNVLTAQAKAPKNGYAFVYVSNESDVQAVYFDNLAVVHTRSKLLEEATYYPFGLKIAPLSAQAFQKPTAPDKFQGDYSDYEEEVGCNDFDLRSYDPQIGRWLQVDPYDEFASPYIGMGNDPVNNTDPSGGGTGEGNTFSTTVHVIGGVTVTAKARRTAGGIPILKDMMLAVIESITAYAYVNQSGDGVFLNSRDLGETHYNTESREMYYRSDVWEKMQEADRIAKMQEWFQEQVERRMNPGYGQMMGFLEAGRDAVWSMLSVFNPEVKDNTLYKVVIHRMMNVTPGADANELIDQVKNTDFTDPTTQGMLAFHATSMAAPIVGELKLATATEMIGGEASVFYRGGGSLEMSAADISSGIDKTTGLMKERGISLNTNKFDKFVQIKGGAYEVDLSTVPKELQIKFTSGTHYELAPRGKGMALENYQNHLKQVQLKQFNSWP